MANIQLDLEEFPVVERKVVQPKGCWSLSPSPSVMYRGDKYAFVICCCDCGLEVLGRWEFLDENGTQLQEDVFTSESDPCAAIQVTVPVGATQFCLLVACGGLGGTGRPCVESKCIPCQRSPTGIASIHGIDGIG